VFSRRRLLKGMAMLSATAVLAGCGALTGQGEGEDRPIVVGTTGTPSALDPAGAWDGSWELYRNIYQSLMHFPGSSGSPKPDAAKSCGFTDNASQVYRCTLKDDLKFSNGNKLDAEAVKFSFERTLQVDADTGPAQLLENLDRIETDGDRTVIFHLKKPNATFPLILATPATALVDPEVYPADKLLDSDEIVGSGPYLLDSYAAGERAELVKNGNYKGSAKLKNDAVTIRYFQDSERMARALRGKRIDLVYRGLTPEQIIGFEDRHAKDASIQLSEVTGTSISFLVFNPKDPAVENPAVREAVAQLIDRKALAREVYQRTTEPLYSMVPGGITGHTSAFYDTYGEPSQRKAKATLTAAGITEPVKFTLWYATDRYGAITKAEFEEIQRQLNGSGLFDIAIEGREWNEFQKGYSQGAYPAFGRGWFPDFPDADNYIGPFVGKKNALGIPYEDTELTGTLLPRSRQESDRGAAVPSLEKAQRILAEDARLLPLWQGKVYIAAQEEIAGLERTIDASTIMQVWELHRKSSW
jgi:peptide/nickel transport system substrate-binding protein